MLLLPDLLLQGHGQHLAVKGEELVDGKLLDLRRGGEKLVVGIGLLLLRQLVKLVEELLLLVRAQLVKKPLWMALSRIR